MLRLSVKKKLRGAMGPFELDVTLDVQKNEIISVFGVSGSGKTTLLRMIAGLISPDEGRIGYDEEIWFDKKSKIVMKAGMRKIGYVQQDYGLFPHMSVWENLNYALPGKTEGKEKLVNEMLNLMRLRELRAERPGKLSGGQQQRVALARALITRPNVLLLDEPLSALDQSIRRELQDEILSLHRIFEIPIIIVSHDVSEVFKLATKVYILEGGKIVKSGLPKEVWLKNKISGKYKLCAEVLAVEKEDCLAILTVLVGQDVVKVVVMEDELNEIEVGRKIILASKAFNPVVLPVIEN